MFTISARHVFFVLVAGAFVSLTPSPTLAGSAYYGTPGTYYFTVPAYGTLTVQVWGGGGGGGARGFVSGTGSNGGTSSFGSVYATGGYLANSYNPGSGGYGSGGDTNLNGGSGSSGLVANGGGGGSSPYGGAGATSVGVGMVRRGNPGSSPGGGGGGGFNSHYWGDGGGGGGYASKIYSPGQLTPGSVVTVSVGSAGSGQTSRPTASNSGGAGAPGAVYITWTDAPAPSCTLTTDWDPINKHVGTILRWSTTNATSLSINQSIGSVSPVSSGNRNIYPQVTTTYTGTVSGAGGSATCGRTVTVTPDPTGTLTLDEDTIAAGESTTLRWNTTNAYSVFIMSDEGEGEFPTFGGSGAVSANGSSSVSPGVTTTYTLYVYDRAGDPDPLVVEATLDVLASCMLDGATVPHGESRTFYSATTAPQGEACSSLAEERTCTDGVLSGSSSYQYASCACAVSYTCDGSTIRQTDASCVVSDLETCVSPQFCSEGSSVCHYAPLGFISGGGRSGHLEAVPSLVRSGDTTKLYWNIENAASCSVSGNGQSWNTSASGVGGKTTAPITKVTTYTLQCTGLSGSSLTEYATVRVVPGWRER